MYMENFPLPQGHIGLFLTKDKPIFVSLSEEDEKYGYFEIPQETVLAEQHMKNLIVQKASVFMAKRMSPLSNSGSGIKYLEVGTGYGNGTQQNPQSESLTQTALRQPLARKEITSWTFLTPAGTPTQQETNVLQLTTVFEANEAIGAIVEMGLFGGDATETLGSGYMYNYKTFPVWNKQAGQLLTVVWRLTF